MPSDGYSDRHIGNLTAKAERATRAVVYLIDTKLITDGDYPDVTDHRSGLMYVLARLFGDDDPLWWQIVSDTDRLLCAEMGEAEPVCDGVTTDGRPLVIYTSSRAAIASLLSMRLRGSQGDQ